MNTNVLKFTHPCCGGQTAEANIPLPLRAEVVTVSDFEDDDTAEVTVWLMANEEGHHVVTVMENPTGCRPLAQLVCDAFNAFLVTEEGQKAAQEYVKHSF